MAMLLRETLYDNRIIVEKEDNDGSEKKLFLKGICIQGSVRNHNQRIYPVNEISRAVDHIMETIRRGETVFGEADHPEELTINIDRISHHITKMWMEGANGIGKLRILPTPLGKICSTLIECETRLGVSSRGSGNVDDQGYVSDFEIVTVDVVARPSAPEAFPIPVYESLNWKRGPIVEDLAKAVLHDAAAQKHLTKELLAWTNRLNLRS